ncbi:MAG: hypothetical protein PWP23_2693 [Candidatus Sumerlaeota bacterium]|nr:hypothetical protein [Candidatus Sumerlaeota bacterium]
MSRTDLECGIKAARLGKLETALSYYDKAVAAGDGQGTEALGHRAWLRRTLGKFADALADYEELLRIQSGNEEAAVLRAEMLFRLDRTDEALRQLMEILTANPLNRSASKLLGGIQESLGLAQVPPAPKPSHDNLQPKEPINPVIKILESDPTSYPGSVFPEIGRFLYSFVRLLRPTNVAEIGVLFGYSSLCITQALEENGGGHLHSFDLFLDRSDGYCSPVTGVRGTGLEVAWGHLEKAGLAHRVSFHQGDSSSKIREAFPDKSVLFDLAFIDGDHTLEGCLKDWQAIDERLGEGGIVLLHDTLPENCGCLGPRRLLIDLEKRYPGMYHAVDLPTPEGFGLAIIQKRSAQTPEKWKITLRDQVAEYLFLRRIDG